MMSLPAMPFGDTFCVSRKDRTGGGGVHPKGANSMAVSGLGFRMNLVDTEWAVSPPMHKQAALLPYRTTISGSDFFSRLDEQLMAESCDN